MAWNKYLTVEIPIFITVFCSILQFSVNLNLKIYRTCYVLMEYNETDCIQLGKESNDLTKFLETKTQPTVNNMNMVTQITNSLNLIYCLYVGMWSDRFGRKPFLLLCLTGITLSAVIIMVCTFFHYLSPWWFITSQLPLMVIGNMVSFYALATTYIADVTDKSNRMIRMVLFNVVVTLGKFLGNFLTPYILYNTSYEFCNCIIVGLLGLCILYTLFFIPESLPLKQEEFQSNKLLKYINFTEIAHVALKRRPKNGRSILCLTILVLLLLSFTSGEAIVVQLFLRAKLQWTLTKISMLNSITGVASIVAMTLGLYIFYQKLKIKEIPISFFSTIVSVVTNTLRVLAVNDYYIYAASAVSLFAVLDTLMLRTLLTFMVAPDEMGQLIALLDIIVSLLETGASLTYSFVYNSTINVNPANYNYLSIGVNVAGGIILAFLLRVDIPHYSPPIEEKSKSESTAAIISLENSEKD